jgi:hypothetical protein
MEHQICTVVTHRLFDYLKTWCDARPLDNGCLLVTPFQHYDHSFIELSVAFQEGTYILSDEGETLAMLFVSGLAIEQHSSLFHVVKQIAHEHGVTFEQEVLAIQATEETLGEKMHVLIHAIQRVGFLIYRRQHRTSRTFRDTVETLILKTQVLYTPDYTLRGKANTHTVDFSVNSGRNLLIDVLRAATVSAAREKVRECAYKHLDLHFGNVTHEFVLVIDDRKSEHLQVWQDEEIQNTLKTYFAQTSFYWSSEQHRLIHVIKGHDLAVQQRYALNNRVPG